MPSHRRASPQRMNPRPHGSGFSRHIALFRFLLHNIRRPLAMPSDSTPPRHARFEAVREIGKALVKLHPYHFRYTVLRESRVSAQGWPDFFVTGPEGRAVLLAVHVAAEDASAEEEMEAAFFRDGEAPRSVESLAMRLREVRESWKMQHPESAAAPTLMIVCPLTGEDSLRQQWPDLACQGVLLTPKESCPPARLLETLSRLPQTPASEADLTLMRAFFAPETVIHSTPLGQRGQAPPLPHLLDYEQDVCSKIDLWIPQESREDAKNFALRLVTGAAGTGKSVVLAHRATLLRQFFPQARIAVLTHNRALRNDLESRFQRMSGSGGVEFHTFYSWLGKMWPSRARAVSGREREAFLPRSPLFSAQFLKEEFDWIHDQGLQSEGAYLDAPRTGRATPLRASQRRSLHALLEDYRRRLDAGKATDWPRRAFQALEARPRGARYDFILADEAQFFARTWLRLIRRALAPGGHLFLCADPAQGFLGRGQSWRDAGLEVKGRAIVLKRPYRSTRQILDYASAAYERHIADDAEAPRLQEMRHEALREGRVPGEIFAPSPQKETAAAVAQTRELVRNGTDPASILILCARRWQVGQIQKQLAAASLPAVPLDADSERSRTGIMVGTIDAATGLERPVVLLCGLREFATHEQNLSLPEEERRRHRRHNASRLYMACTRATERLFVVSSGSNPLLAAP